MKDLNYWKNNAEEDYITTPISVLRYITELEKEAPKKQFFIYGVVKSFYKRYKNLLYAFLIGLTLAVVFSLISKHLFYISEFLIGWLSCTGFMIRKDSL